MAKALVARRSSNVLLNIPGKLSSRGWIAPEEISIEDWVRCGTMFGQMEGAVQWWRGDWWVCSEDRKWGDGAEIAERAGVDYWQINNYASVARAYNFSRRREKLSFKHHAEAMAAETTRERMAWLKRAEKGRWSANKLRAEIARSAAVQKVMDVELEAKKLGKFVVLYADPPWQYENPPMGGTNRSIENQYPTMELKEILAMGPEIKKLAHKDAMLFLWATAPKLPECIEVVREWGFEARTNMVWDKVHIGMGYHVRGRHEILLICKRGELPPPDPKNRPASIFTEKREEHSAKPSAFYEIIDSMYPKVRKIELFARPEEDGKMPERKGWAFWGNQIGDSK